MNNENENLFPVEQLALLTFIRVVMSIDDEEGENEYNLDCILEETPVLRLCSIVLE